LKFIQKIKCKFGWHRETKLYYKGLHIAYRCEVCNKHRFRQGSGSDSIKIRCKLGWHKWKHFWFNGLYITTRCEYCGKHK